MNEMDMRKEGEIRMFSGYDSNSTSSTIQTSKQAWRALGSLCLGTFVCFANTTTFNVALPAISVSLGSGQVEQQWMVSIYNLIFAAFMLLSGSLGDRWGVKRTLLLGTGAFIVASGIGIFAPNSMSTIIARGLMGLGAGFYVPMGLALIKYLFESDAQMRALTIRAIAMTLGAPFGLLLGGLLVNLTGWHSIFVFDLAAFAVILALNALFLPDDKNSSCENTLSTTKVPLFSAILALIGLSFFSAGLINAQISLSRPDAWGLVGAGIITIALFAYRDIRSENPLADLNLLRISSFAASAISLLALNLAISGILFVLPAYVEIALGNSALVGALMLMPMVVAAMIGSVITGKVTNKWGKRRACLGSLLFIVLGLAVMALSTTSANYYLMAAGQCICGLGMGMGLPAMQSWGMERVLNQQVGGGAALISTFQQVGCLLGIGILGSLTGSWYAAACEGTVAESFASISLAFEAAHGQDAMQAQALRAAASSAYAYAILIAFCVTAILLLLVAGFVAYISKSEREEHAGKRKS